MWDGPHKAVLRPSILRPTVAPGKAEHEWPVSLSIASAMTIEPRKVRDAGGSRTHLNRVAAGRLAVWLQRQERNVLARN